jgi:hypothetical protein
MRYESQGNVHSTEETLQKGGRVDASAGLICATSLNPPDTYTGRLKSG